MQVQFNTTNNHRHSIAQAKSSRGTSSHLRTRSLSWKPQASSLTRDETRELVLEMIG